MFDEPDAWAAFGVDVCYGDVGVSSCLRGVVVEQALGRFILDVLSPVFEAEAFVEACAVDFHEAFRTSWYIFQDFARILVEQRRHEKVDACTL